jgi:hypothetical protein
MTSVPKPATILPVLAELRFADEQRGERGNAEIP